ncbi:MAG: Ig-like domain-containing protein [Candidatus Limnocylindria bacterium]
MSARLLPRVAVAALAAAAMAGALVPIGPTAAAEYEMTTEATYSVDPAAETIAVNVAIAFTNTFAAPAGQASVFREIRLAIHDRAASVTAGDGSGALNVSTAVSAGVNVATVTLRAPLAYGKTATLELAYALRDGDDPEIRVGEHLVSFPAWGFGTQSAVSVDLPADFEVRVDGDPMDASTEADRVILESGPIDDPTRWLAHVGATREAVYATLQRAVPLRGGTVDLEVRHWDDDVDWGETTMDLLIQALPRLEAAFGLPYPGQGPLVVTESVTGGGLDAEAVDGEVAVGFFEPPFTLFHQVAHLWANDALASDRWIVEGLASWAAAHVSDELELELPYDPVALAAELEAEAFPLVAWSSEDRSAEAEAWAYATAWSLTDEAARLAGDEGFHRALARIAGGLDGYDLLTVDSPDAAPTVLAADSRAYLDHLDAITDQPIVEALAEPVLGTGSEDVLAARAAARTAYQGLLDLAGDWGDPDPVRAAMVEWRFPDAEAEIAAAGEWLIERNRLLFEIERVGLIAPDRLAAAYQTHGGGQLAWAEIDAERLIMETYADVAASLADGLDPIARVGLLIGPGPDERLAGAAAEFAAGNLQAAADQLASLKRDLGTATAGGLARILGLLVAVGAAAVLVSVGIRRRRATTVYTPGR